MADITAAPERQHRPHDLLWVDDPSALLPVDAWPAWATPDWLARAPAVVRRAPRPSGDRLPVGLRGAARSERCAAHLRCSRVIRRVTPEDVAQRTTARHAGLLASGLACLRTLVRISPLLDATALAWGVTGGVGFVLASGFDVLHADSDLDLLVRIAERRDAVGLRDLIAVLKAAECRVDVQVETQHGAFALGEWLRTGGPVLLKTSLGPVLVDDPWEAAAASVERSLSA